MEILTREIVYHSTHNVYKIYFFGDVHWGSWNCDEVAVDATLKQIEQDPFARVFLMGDLCEYISTRDWRYEPDLIAEWVNKNDTARCEEEYATAKLEPIKNKILGAIQGNHEYTIERDANMQTHAHLCDALGIVNLGYSALVNLTFIRRSEWSGYGGDYRGLTLYLHHGYGGGRTMGADANRFDQMIKDYSADWYFAGHTHKRYAVPHVQHYINRMNRLAVKNIFYGRTGTYLKGIDEGQTPTYAERNGMTPLGIGSLVMEYDPRSGEAIAKI